MIDSPAASSWAGLDIAESIKCMLETELKAEPAVLRQQLQACQTVTHVAMHAWTCQRTPR